MNRILRLQRTAYPTNVEAAQAYERRNKLSGHGLMVPLSGGPGGHPFWSKGWTGCDVCGYALDRPMRLTKHVTIDRIAGTVTVGFYCRTPQ